MPISQTFLYLQGTRSHFLKARPVLIKDAKNRHHDRNRFNHFCRKTGFKNITITHINRFGPCCCRAILLWFKRVRAAHATGYEFRGIES